MSNDDNGWASVDAGHPAVREAQERFEQRNNSGREAATIEHAGVARADHAWNGQVNLWSDGRFEIEQTVPMEVSTADLTALTGAPSSVLDTVLTEGGHRPMEAIKPSDVVHIPALGSAISVAAATAMGVLRRLPDGSYTDTAKGLSLIGARGPFDQAAGNNADPAAQQQQDQPKDEAPQQPPQPAFAPTGNQHLDQVLNQAAPKLGPLDVQILATHALHDGTFPDVVLDAIARKANMPSDMARMVVNGAMEAFGTQAAAALNVFGEDSEAVQWAHQHRPRELQEAALTHATTGDRSGYAEIARSYAKSLERSNEGRALLLRATLPAGAKMLERAGRIGVQMPSGKTFSWSEVIDLGLVEGIPALRGSRR